MSAKCKPGLLTNNCYSFPDSQFIQQRPGFTDNAALKQQRQVRGLVDVERDSFVDDYRTDDSHPSRFFFVEQQRVWSKPRREELRRCANDGIRARAFLRRNQNSPGGLKLD